MKLEKIKIKENNVTCLIKRGNQYEWAAANPVLALGELAVAYKNEEEKIYKIGDGHSSWTELPEITKIEELGSEFMIMTVDGKEVKVVLDPWGLGWQS